MKQFLVEIEGKTYPINADFPDICPVCLHNIEPSLKVSVLENGAKARVQAVFQCPRAYCRSLFIAYYDPASLGNYYDLLRLAPQTPNLQKFSEHIVSISKDFPVIFNQAQLAEQLELSEIGGPGYRKSLEFLIKDYALSRYPEKADDIKSKQLGTVIGEYVTDGKIKSTAKRAAWLGNDETHYYRNWENKDIKDLKILIELTVRWIESEELTRKYEEEMT